MPDKENAVTRSTARISVPLLTPNLNLESLGLLHHFILYAHPHLPVGHQNVWVTHLPARACEVSLPQPNRSLLHTDRFSMST